MSSEAIITVIGIAFLIFVLYFVPIGHWFTAKMSGVKISLLELTFMNFRKVPATLIVKALILAEKEEVEGIDHKVLQAQHLAGGDVLNVVAKLISAKKSGIKLSLKDACKSDLDGVSFDNVLKNSTKKENI